MQPLQGRPLLPHSGPLTRGTAERGWGAMPQNAAVGTVEAVVLEAFVAAVPGGVERPLLPSGASAGCSQISEAMMSSKTTMIHRLIGRLKAVA